MADRPDGFDFRSDGTVLCFIDSEQWRLRRPKTKEFKSLRLAVRERDDEITKLQQDAALRTRTGEGEQLSEEQAAEKLVEARHATRDVSDRQEELDKAWIDEVFRTLADHPLPQPDVDAGEALGDDWPVWLWQGENLGKFLDHWRAVPLARGPQ